MFAPVDECYHIGTRFDSGTTLFYAGRRIDNQDAKISAHIHGHYEFTYFTQGNTKVEIENKTFHSKAGDLFIIKPGYEHSITAESDIWEIQYFGLGTIAPPMYEEIINGFNDSVLHKFTIADHIMPKIVAEMKSCKLGMQLLLSSLVNQLLVEMARKINPRSKERRSSSMAVGMARSLIDTNGRHNMSMRDLAKECCLSESRLAHIFTIENGTTLNKYLTSVLMHRAVRLLADDINSISDVASALGYPSLQYFDCAFKKFWGCSPTEYRKIFKINKSE